MNITSEPSSNVAIIDFESRNAHGTYCKCCQKTTRSIVNKKVGVVTVGWCLCLFVFTGVLWLYPCCTRSCKDTELVCADCNAVKVVTPANCC